MLVWNAAGKLSKEFLDKRWELCMAIHAQRAKCNSHWLAAPALSVAEIDKTLKANQEASRLLGELKQLLEAKSRGAKYAQEIAAYIQMGFGDEDLWNLLTFEWGVEIEQAAALLEWGKFIAEAEITEQRKRANA